MKTRKNCLIILFLILVTIATVFFANKITFYHYNTSLGKEEMKEENNTKSEVDGQVLWFTYSKNSINLNLDSMIQASQVAIYSMTEKGSVLLLNSDSIKLKDDYTGSFIAVAPEIQMDINNDGVLERVFAAAKTDTLLTQGFNKVNTQFGNDKLPFEVILSDENILTFFYKGIPLVNSEIIVNSVNNPNQKMTTNAEGKITEINTQVIRKGLNFQYKNAEGRYYTLSYQVETNTIFTSRYLEAMKPIIFIFIYSFILIVILLILKNIKNRNLDIIKIRKLHIHFSTVRWITMIASFFILVFGFRFFAIKITAFDIPVFACPKNTDQFIGSSCYNLSHLSSFLKSSKWTIISFFATTMIIIILFGRTLCGFVCPFGLIQDIVYKIRDLFKIDGFQLNEKLYNILKLFKWVMLIIFFGACTVGVSFCDFCPAIITSPAFAGIKTSLYMSGFIVIFFIVASFFKRRFWCNICPLGYAVGLFSKISIFKIRKNCQACTECGACYEACPMGIKSIYTERKKEDITTNDCIMCGECVNKCPENDAISMAVLKKKFYVSSRLKFFKRKNKSKLVKEVFFNKEQ